MKKLKFLLLTFILLLCVAFSVSCDKIDDNNNDDNKDNNDNQTNDSEAIDITGVSFQDTSFTYDGTEKTIIAENIPAGISAEYKNNKQTDAGKYEVSVDLSGEGYKPLTLKAELTIMKAELSNIKLTDDEKVKSDGQPHLPTIVGTLPDDVQLKWYFNNELSNEGVMAIGEYTVKLVISGKNYVTKEITGSFNILLDLAGFAKELVDAMGKTPDAWAFLPDSFKMENLVVDSTSIDYTDFVDVNSIPKCYIGKQMNVIYSLLNKCDSALVYVNQVHAVMNTIEQLYQAYLNGNPDNYKSFSGEAGSAAFLITVTDTHYILKVNIGTVSVEMSTNLSDKSYGARIQLTESNVIKYEVSEGHFKVAMDVLDSAAVQIEFIRDTENTQIVNGYIYEYLTVAGKEVVNTSAYLHVGEKYTTVVGTKGDFIPTAEARNCEIYETATARFVGSEVSEVLDDEGARAYDTLWLNLYDISGITSIRKEDSPSGVNPDTIYINGKTSKIGSMMVNAFKLDFSRRFDIEFKMVCAYTYDAATEEYTLVEFEVPLVFIQESMFDTFEADFKSENLKATGDPDVDVQISNEDKAAIVYGYRELVKVYNTIKSLVTQKDINDYCKASIV